MRPKAIGDVTMLWLHTFPLDDPHASRADFIDWMDGSERLRADSYTSVRLREQYITSRTYLRAILAGHCGRRAQDLTFMTRPLGKPFLADGPYFNLAHAADRGFLAISDYFEVGIDAEPRTRVVRSDLLDAIGSAAEREAARRCIPAKGDVLQLWVRKEAITKAIGCGIRADLTRIDAGIGRQTPGYWQTRRAFYEQRCMEYRYVDVGLHQDFYCSIAELTPEARLAASRPPARA